MCAQMSQLPVYKLLICFMPSVCAQLAMDAEFVSLGEEITETGIDGQQVCAQHDIIYLFQQTFSV